MHTNQHQQHQNTNRLLITSLPPELIRKILLNLNKNDLMALCFTSKDFYLNIVEWFLYRNVELFREFDLRLFLNTILNNPKLAHYVKSIKFHNPLEEEEEEEKKHITPASNIISFNNELYVELLLSIISILPNLREVSILEIPSGFKFPITSLNTLRKLSKLTITCENDWSIPLRPNLLWSFGDIHELSLSNMLIDSNSLKDPNHPDTSPPHPDTSAKGFISPIKNLTLTSCSITSTGSKHLSTYFQNVETLQLIELNNYFDLLICKNFSNLKYLAIDLNSKCFSLYNLNEFNSINVGNFNSNYSYYNSKFIPKFYLNYLKFKEFIEFLPVVSKITLVNVSFSNLLPINPNLEINLVNNNLFSFLKFLSNFNSIEFVLLKNYKIHQKRNRTDWKLLLGPCFTDKNMVQVKDKDGFILFSK